MISTVPRYLNIFFFGHLMVQVTCFAEAGGQYVSEMARAVELLGLRACLTKSTMDCGDGLPPNWSTCSTDDCIQVFSCPRGDFLLNIVKFI
jgi:hypothetical protein